MTLLLTSWFALDPHPTYLSKAVSCAALSSLYLPKYLPEFFHILVGDFSLEDHHRALLPNEKYMPLLLVYKALRVQDSVSASCLWMNCNKMLLHYRQLQPVPRCMTWQAEVTLAFIPHQPRWLGAVVQVFLCNPLLPFPLSF